MQIKNRQKFLAILAVTGLALLAGDSLIFEPLVKSWQARNKHIAELNDKIEKGNQTIARQAAIRDRWNHMQRNALTRTSAENEMLKAFDRWSQDSRVSVTGIKPQWKQTEDDYMTLECRADASGSMDTLARFIYEVERDSAALKVDTVEITAHDNDGQQLSLGLTVSGLVLNPQEP